MPIHSTRRGPGTDRPFPRAPGPDKFPPSCRQMRAGGPRNATAVIDKIAAMTRIAVVVPALLLTACSDQVAVPVSRTNGWKIAHSPNMPASMSGSEGNWYFDFPTRNGVHYVYKPAPAIKVGQIIKMHSPSRATQTLFQQKAPQPRVCGCSSNNRAIRSRPRSHISAGGAYLMLNCVRVSLR